MTNVFLGMPTAAWVLFNLFVLGMLALDLGVFHRKSHAVGAKEALSWSIVWITLALLFDLGLYYWQGSDVALKYLTGYLIEKSLSIDNIFVFILIFTYFRVPPEYQHRVLFWGILGALVMRGALIITGASLLERFHWVIYIFGGFLVYTGIRMFLQRDEHADPGKNPMVRLVRRLFPVSDHFAGHHFLTRINGRRCATPLLVVLAVIETSDLIFAVDSIPAVFAVTTNPFIVYTSNVFAILGLRALYFLLAGVMGMFRFLKVGLSAILVFVGTKMLVADIYHIPTLASLAAIVIILALSIMASLWLPEKTG